ncbi:MAG: hypothetical protein SFY70_10215 [Bacteroidia bacterium]|nr:hypothetical protein [Bacteroidia bacterium]
MQTNAIDQYRQLKPALLATGQKQWRVDGHWAVNVGAQAGINVSDRLSYKQLLAFGYGLVVYTHHHNRISLGPYVGNRNYLGLGNEVGLLLGAEVPLVPRLHLMTDWIVGTNDESVATLGVMFMVTPHVQFCAGGFAGSFGSENKGGIVVEVNVLTWPDWPAGRQRSPH